MSQLIAYRKSQVTADTAEALRRLERAGHDLGGVRIQYEGVPSSLGGWGGVREDPGPLKLPEPLSMRPTGREVYLRVKVEGSDSREVELATLWSLAVPLGFVPWSRYPVPGDTDQVFHYFGHWSSLGDFLQGEGRGEEAWPSICGAAQCEVGVWEGPKKTERSVQANLHRLGIHCGPVDGMIGDRTLAALRALGLGGVPLSEALGGLEKMEAPMKAAEDGKSAGHFSMAEGPLPEAFSSGGVHTIKTRSGYAVSADGPGRLILLFGENY